MLFYKCEIIVTGNKLHSYQNSSVLLIYFFKISSSILITQNMNSIVFLSVTNAKLMQPVTLWSTFITISSTADTVILDLYTTHNDHLSLLSFFFIHNVHIPNSQISSVFHRITRKPFCVYVLFLVSRSIFHHTTQAIIEAPSKNY